MGDLPHMIVHNGEWRFGFNKNALGPPYEPLINDAHAMALVKKFHLRIGSTLVAGKDNPQESWFVERTNHDHSVSDDLNRAICECVAKMQAAK